MEIGKEGIKSGITTIEYVPFSWEDPHKKRVNQQENYYYNISCKVTKESAYLLSENCKHTNLKISYLNYKVRKD